MRNLNIFTGTETDGAPDKVKSWSVAYPYADGDFTLPIKDPFQLPVWMGTGPYCNFAHGAPTNGRGQPVGLPKRLTNPLFSNPPKGTP